MPETKTYLGDGAYASRGRYAGEIILTTENGIEVLNTIYLDPVCLDNLEDFRKRMNDNKS